MYTHTHTHTQGKSAEIYTPTIWNVIVSSMTTPSSVLSPSSIQIQSSSYCTFFPTRKELTSFSEILLFHLLYDLAAFTELRRANISFVMSVRPSVLMKELGSHWTNFHEILYLSIFQKYFEKVKFLLKDEKNNGHFI
jgi:hypothetical protein